MADRFDLVFLGHGAERTGPPVYLLRLLTWLRANTDLRVAVVLFEGGPLLDQFRALAPTWVIPDDPGNPPGPWPSAPVAYVNTAGSVRVLDSLPEPPRAIVTHVHELSVGLDYFLDAADRTAALDGAHHVWAVADAVADHVAEAYGRDRDSILIHRGLIDPGGPRGPAEPSSEPVVEPAAEGPSRAALGWPDDAVVVGASGTLDWRKAPELFVSVAAAVRRRSPVDVRFLWIGGNLDSEFSQSAQRDVERLGLGDAVRFVGEQPDAGSWFSLLDLFLLPSREDAYPLVVPEAAALGVPTICFATGGIPEFVGQDAGRVVPYPDLEAMADQVIALATDPALRAQLGAAARRRALAHTPDVAGPLWLHDIRAVLDQSRG